MHLSVISNIQKELSKLRTANQQLRSPLNYEKQLNVIWEFQNKMLRNIGHLRSTTETDLT